MMSKMPPEANRALMKYAPEYFTMTDEEKQKFSLALRSSKDTDKLNSNIQDFIEREIGGVDFKRTQTDDAEIKWEEEDDRWHKYTEATKTRINEVLLYIFGIGDNYFFLNEFGGAESLQQHTTLGAFDEADHDFQEKCKLEDENLPNHTKIEPYRLSLRCWARMIIEDKFYYSNLDAIQWQLYYGMEELGYEIIDTLIPNEFVNGPDHGKEADGGYLWDMKSDANGLEPQLDELKSRSYKFLTNRVKELTEEFEAANIHGVYIKDSSEEDDPHLNFIFTDTEVIKDINFMTFYDDCMKNKRDISEYNEREEKERDLYGQFLHEQFKDIMENFDTKVVKLKKKHNIIMAPGALRGLDE